jgi:hypothetical protein
MALPDKRYCFDFFHPLTRTGEWLSAYMDDKFVHTPRTAFDHAAYAVTADGKVSWGRGECIHNMKFAHDLDMARAVFDRSYLNASERYYDFHAWRFTPASFDLLILETTLLGLIEMRTVNLSKTIFHEFFVDLVKGRRNFESTSACDERRMRLLMISLRDLADDRVPAGGVGARGRSCSPAGLAGYVRRPRRAA